MADGAVVLPGFLRPEAKAVTAVGASAVQHRAFVPDQGHNVSDQGHFVSDQGHNVYLDVDDVQVPPDYLRDRHVRRVVGRVAYDDLDVGSSLALLSQLYERQPLLEFVRAHARNSRSSAAEVSAKPHTH